MPGAPSTRGRATTWDEFVHRTSLIGRSQEEAYRFFEPRPTDVIISPFFKCGTTWLQQIVHGLRTNGDMDFDDIYEVVPFIDVALEMGIDLNGEQKAEPRAFKSHFSWDGVPKGCRYIVSFRDPQDAVVSWYHFMDGWIIEPGTIPIDEFVAHFAFDRETGPDYWRHASSWLRQRDNPDVLLLTFESMKDDLPHAVDRIADFIGVEAQEARDIAVRNSSFEFMSANSEPFSELLMRAHAARVAAIPVDSQADKIRRGNVGEGRNELAAATRDRFAEIWRETIASEFGYKNYRALDQSIREGIR